ncbi:hypothetical protein MJG53_007984 [Ovis ammon polii x Ovis aries]|uniref:Uncharacterized protein n=1 Tax=Ovis ammon polii x Ovis aries TaxID=2918886 RepID=A0ACB9UZX5_9CETA|nr:hypothetical protein MJG53_007984 [Ovis ammon polii x Ovis aries]
MKPERGRNNRGSEAIKEVLEDLFRRASGSRASERMDRHTRNIDYVWAAQVSRRLFPSSSSFLPHRKGTGKDPRRSENQDRRLLSELMLILIKHENGGIPGQSSARGMEYPDNDLEKRIWDPGGQRVELRRKESAPISGVKRGMHSHSNQGDRLDPRTRSHSFKGIGRPPAEAPTARGQDTPAGAGDPQKVWRQGNSCLPCMRAFQRSGGPSTAQRERSVKTPETIKSRTSKIHQALTENFYGNIIICISANQHSHAAGYSREHN